MKVLLISTNINTMFRSHFPNGTGALSAFLKQHGFDVRLFHADKYRELSQLPRILMDYSPEVVGITATACQGKYVHQLSTMVKKWKKVPVICGGVHPTLVPEFFIKLDAIDGVLRGEGELAFLEYLQKRQDEIDTTYIKNFWFKNNGEVIKNKPREFIEDLDTLPYMDREALDYQKIINLNNGVVITMLSRGCAWGCTFCSNSSLRKHGVGNYVRYRSVENALGDIEQLSKKYRFNYIFFRDDNFTSDREWTLKFTQEYSKKFKYPFDILTRADCLDKEVMDSLKEAGCSNIFIGLDSGNDYIRNEILKKEQSNEKLIEVCDYLNAIGIKVVISNIIGLPFETPERFQDTIEINKRIHKKQVVFSSANGACPKIWVFNPFPGTPLYKLCKEQGWLKEMPDDYKVYRESYIDMPGFSRKEIDALYRKFRYLVYKDSHPFFAWLFRLHDSRLGQFIMDLLPAYGFGQIRRFFAYISILLKPKVKSDSK